MVGAVALEGEGTGRSGPETRNQNLLTPTPRFQAPEAVEELAVLRRGAVLDVPVGRGGRSEPTGRAARNRGWVLRRGSWAQNGSRRPRPER